MRILLAEDNPVDRKVMRTLLEKAGHTVFIAHNGKEALKMVKEVDPDLMVLDIIMPMVDGFEVCERVKGIPNLAGIPILVVTVLDDFDTRQQVKHQGLEGYIIKPFDPDKFIKKVNEIIS